MENVERLGSLDIAEMSKVITVKLQGESKTSGLSPSLPQKWDKRSRTLTPNSLTAYVITHCTGKRYYQHRPCQICR